MASMKRHSRQRIEGVLLRELMPPIEGKREA